MMCNKLLSLLPLVSLAFAQSPGLIQVLNGTDTLSNLTSLVASYPELVNTLGQARDITVLAPSNDALNAFMAMPQYKGVSKEAIQAILTYHVLNGTYRSSDFNDDSKFLPTLLGDYPEYRNLSGPQVVKATEDDDRAYVYGGLNMRIGVERADIAFDGGVVHILNSVIPPPMNVTATASALNLTSLAGALVESNLDETVDSLSNVTIFAPNNAAFMAIGNLLPNLSPEQTRSILTYHVVPGAVAYSTSLQNNMKVGTVNGEQLTIRIEDDDVFVNGARVIMTDILVNSGVVHVIDGVLNPNSTNDTPDENASTQPAAFPSATMVSDAPFATSAPNVTAPSNPDATGSAPEQSSSETGGVSKNSVSGLIVAAVAASFAFGMVA